MSEELRELLQRPDADIDLVRGALLIARQEYPDLDIGLCEQRFRSLAETARERQDAVPTGSRAALESLCEFLFRAKGFQGNYADYYDPRNSYLNEVLDRRLGIPITLALVAFEIGRRIDLDTYGIGFPGRFLMGCRLEQDCEVVVVDCHNGCVVDHRGCQLLLKQIYGGAMEFDPELLRPATSRQVLARVVANLLTIYIQRRDVTRALRLADLAVVTEPEEPHAYRNRGLLYFEAGDYPHAIADLEECLRRLPEGSAAPVIQHHIEKARARLASWN